VRCCLLANRNRISAKRSKRRVIGSREKQIRSRVVLMHSRKSSGSRSIATPSASSTSALPLRESNAAVAVFHDPSPRLQPETNVIAVETLNRSMPSPPVPQTSTIGPSTSISKGTARLQQHAHKTRDSRSHFRPCHGARSKNQLFVFCFNRIG